MTNIDDINFSSLDKVCATTVYIMENVGVFHYNKLAYLFEYFFIKNFGHRYSKEQFIKLPHGPVIMKYKKQITFLSKLNVFDVNETELNKKRKLEDDINIKISIKSNKNTKNFIISESSIFSLLFNIIEKFGFLSVTDLENEVYKTSPMKKYIELSSSGFKKESGGYILKGCIAISKYKNSVTEGRKLALKHIQKYPTIDFNLQKELANDLSDMEYMRPI